MPDQSQEPGDFAITAQISLVEQRFRTLKHNDMFGVFDQRGDVRPGPGGTEGLYFNDTRYLSEFELVVANRQLVLLSSTLRDDNATLTCDLANPDLPQGAADGGEGLISNLIHIRRSRFLWQGVCHERISIRNFDVVAHTLPVEIRYGADFVDLFEVRGMTRTRHGRHEPAVVTLQTVTLAYTGLDEQRRTTDLRFDPPPARIDEGRALFDIELPAHGRSLIFIEVACDRPAAPRRPSETFLARMIEQRRWTRQRSASAVGIESSNEVFNEAMRRAISDLTMLTTELPTGPYPYAGIPWFSTAFGRDAILTALNVLWMDPAIAAGVLRYLAANQATAHDAASDAEPGKILHEVRRGEMAELGEVPFRRYYGSVDATPLFVMLAGAYLERTGDVSVVAALWPQIQAALGWIDRLRRRAIADGFVELRQADRKGARPTRAGRTAYDSVSSMLTASLAEGPIALVEVQGYVHAAQTRCGRHSGGARGLARARPGCTGVERGRNCGPRIEERFWIPGAGHLRACPRRSQASPCRGESIQRGTPVARRASARPRRAH